MQSNKKRIRIDYAPLNVAVSIKCTTPLSPALQVFNASLPSGNQYEPDREVSPSQFWPEVIITANDGSWANRYANVLLTNMHWYVNNIEISQHASWQGNNGLGNPKYIIDTSNTNSRGAITIQQNISSETPYSLRFEAVIADMRFGNLIPIKSDEIILSTEDVAEDGYSIGISEDQIIHYNPFKDKLHLYDYKVAQGIITASALAENAATDENAYVRTIPVSVYKGPDVITTGYTLALYRVDGVSTFTRLTPTNNKEVVSIGVSSITLDLRLITKQDFLIIAEFNSSSHPNPRIQFSVNRIYQDFTLNTVNGTSILSGDIARYDEVICLSDGNIVDYPESFIKIEWYTDTANKAHQYHNEGQKTLFQIANTGIGNTYTDDWIDIQAEGEIKPAYDVAVDENGDIFVDENDNTYIFN